MSLSPSSLSKTRLLPIENASPAPPLPTDRCHQRLSTMQMLLNPFLTMTHIQGLTGRGFLLQDGAGRKLAKKFGYRDGSGRVVRKFYRQKANIWEINVRQIIIIANGINSQPPKLQTALVWVLDERNQKKSSKYDLQDDGHISSSPVVPV